MKQFLFLLAGSALVLVGCADNSAKAPTKGDVTEFQGNMKAPGLAEKTQKMMAAHSGIVGGPNSAPPTGTPPTSN
jgi:hypothetical protein